MKCKDIAHKYHVTPMQVGRLRKTINPDNTGGDLSDDEVEALTAYFEELDDVDTRRELEQIVKPQFVDGFCSYVQAGRREVECKIRTDEGIKTVIALIPTSVNPEWCINKPMKLEVISYKDKEFYRHAALSGHAWPKGYGGE